MHPALIDPPVRATPLGAAAIDPATRRRPFAGVPVRLGFPSPAEDFIEDGIDLNELLVRNAPATYFYRAEGWSMLMAGICDGDILAVDRSVTPQHGDVVIATWDGNQPTCKVLVIADDHIELHSRNPHTPNIVLPPGTEVEVFVVTGVARQMVRGGRVRAG